MIKKEFWKQKNKVTAFIRVCCFPPKEWLKVYAAKMFLFQPHLALAQSKSFLFGWFLVGQKLHTLFLATPKSFRIEFVTKSLCQIFVSYRQVVSYFLNCQNCVHSTLLFHINKCNKQSQKMMLSCEILTRTESTIKHNINVLTLMAWTVCSSYNVFICVWPELCVLSGILSGIM